MENSFLGGVPSADVESMQEMYEKERVFGGAIASQCKDIICIYVNACILSVLLAAGMITAIIGEFARRKEKELEVGAALTKTKHLSRKKKSKKVEVSVVVALAHHLKA
ncbi:unnamed protein product [Orchesella dallaii]|uniref:Uncharacterized protein n=1 Tax=Orchesella dallaii TaxID=48710 RepID=A0ABP1SAA1_9HEXA